MSLELRFFKGRVGDNGGGGGGSRCGTEEWIVWGGEGEARGL